VTQVTRSVPVTEIRPIGRGAEAAELATAAYDQLFGVLDRLAPDDWSRPTDCTAWDVDDVVGHLLGAAEGHASLPEGLRQLWRGMREKDAFAGNDLDAMNALQVREHAHLAPAQKLAALRSIAPKAVRARTRLPGLLRRIPVPLSDTGDMPSGLPSSITLGHLNEVVLTRDVFLHRIDIARAAGLDPDLRSDADRRIVADVVAEWATRHGQPVRLHLLGPAGGAYHQHEGGPSLELDTAEFCRVVSGRAPGEGLLATHVLF
jgi:uncharacterized protein (TIGR03083 family)